MDSDQKINEIYKALVGDLKNQGLLSKHHDLRHDFDDHRDDKQKHQNGGVSIQLKGLWWIVVALGTGILGIAFFIIRAGVLRE